MPSLEILYQLKEGLKSGASIDEKILDALEKQEEKFIKDEVISHLSENVQSLMSKIQRPVTLTINYSPGKPLSLVSVKACNCDEELDTNHSLKSIDVEKEVSKISREELVEMFKEKTKSPMLEDFRGYLRDKGYSEYTPKGHPSTVYDYSNRIKKICEIEEITLIELSKDIARIVDKYDVGGSKEAIGRQSNRAVISALKCFNDFVND